MKKRFDTLDNNRANELENVLWVIQITPEKSTSETPFCLVYSSKGVALVEIVVSTHRLCRHIVVSTHRRWASHKMQARIRLAMTRYYNRRVFTR